MERNDFQYATKVWLMGVILPGIIFMVYKPGGQVNVGLSILIMIFGGLFSFPSWYLLYRITVYVNNLRRGLLVTKAVLIFCGFFLTLLSFLLAGLLWGGDLSIRSCFDLVENPVFLSYWLSICFGLIIFKLNPATPTEIENISNENVETN